MPPAPDALDDPRCRNCAHPEEMHDGRVGCEAFDRVAGGYLEMCRCRIFEVRL